MRTYSPDITLVLIVPADHLATEHREELQRGGIKLVESSVDRVSLEDGGARALDLMGKEHRFEVIYAAFGTKPRSELLKADGFLIEQFDKTDSFFGCECRADSRWGTRDRVC